MQVTGEEYLETLKEILEANEEELRLIYLITSRVELVGEIVKPLEKDRCIISQTHFVSLIVQGSQGIRYVVNCSNKFDKSKLVSGTRVTWEIVNC